MKIGCTTYSYRQLFSDGRMNIYAFLDRVYELGLDGVELYDIPTDKPTLIKIKRRAMELGLDIASYSIGCPATTAGGDGLKNAKNSVDIGAFLGALVMRVDSGGVSAGMTQEQAFDNAVSFFKELSAYAGDRGITLGLENHSEISNTGAKVEKLVKAIDSPWFGLTIDFGNFGKGEEGYESIRIASQYAYFTHAKMHDIGIKTGCCCTPPCLEEKNRDIGRILDMLIKVGYVGYLSVEYEGSEDPVKAVPKCVKLLRQYI
jgi:sugar phosphate isomerase/epimerase